MTSFVVEAGGGGVGGVPCEGTHSLGEQSRAVEVLWGNKAGLGGRRGVGSGQREKNQYHEGQHQMCKRDTVI